MDILKKNYFDLFEIEIGIDININLLEKKYKYLQGLFHPDKYVNSTGHEKRLALQISSYINDGYLVLKDLIKRIEYILKINNFYKDESNTFNDESFLTEQINYNEFLEDLQKKNKKEINNCKNEIINKTSLIVDDIKKSFSNSEFDNIYISLSKLKFYIKYTNEFNHLHNKK